MTNLAVPSSTSSFSTAASTTARSGSATSGSSSSGSAGSAATLTQSDFLQLLTAQLQYQTPTSPADPTQLASEFAEISTVDGINQLNTTVTGMQSGNAASQMAQAATLVGKQVAVSGNALTPNASGSAEGAFSLAGPAQNVNVTVLSPDGTVAGSIKLGSLAAGQQSFTWNGGLPGQQYDYQVSATSSSNAPVSVTPYTVYTVDSVNVSGSTPSFNVQGNAAPIPVSSIQTVLGTTSS